MRINSDTKVLLIAFVFKIIYSSSSDAVRIVLLAIEYLKMNCRRS